MIPAETIANAMLSGGFATLNRPAKFDFSLREKIFVSVYRVAVGFAKPPRCRDVPLVRLHNSLISN